MKDEQTKKDDRGRKLKLTVEVHLEDAEDEQLPGSMAYVFDTTGRLLARQAIPPEAEGRAVLTLPAALRGRSVRVLVGPAVEIEGAAGGRIPEWMEAQLRQAGEMPAHPARASLKRLGAIERNVRLSDLDTVVRWPIFPGDWRHWLTCHCVVRGRLVKHVPMPNGTVQDWGVCHACVQIYDVDAFPFIIARLPDLEVYRIRDELLRELREWPLKPPRPLPDPPPLVQRFRALPQPAPQISAEAAFHSAGVESIALAASASQLRQELIAQGAWLLPIFCGWPWFMQWFHKDFLTCVMTDDQGYFETTIIDPCFGDHPDLYFRAVQWIGGALHVLYDPGMRCHTHWNYPCGTEVVLVTTDPAARVCEPPADVDLPPGVGTYVLINRVGGILIDSIGPDGLVGYDFVEADGHVSATGAPFGGTLGLRVSHSPNIPSAQLRYYRWQFNRDGEVDAGGDPIWHDFDTPPALPVGRTYADFDLTQPLLPPTFPTYPLGPKGVGGKMLFEFRPQPAELQATAPANHVYQWPVEAVGNDIYSGTIDSTALPGGVANAVGIYWFKVEVYDDAGNKVLPGAGTFQFVILTSADGDSRLALPGELHDGGYVFGLFIDNRRCEAVIDAPSIAAVGADPNCGFLRFNAGDSVTLDFHALQPDSIFAAPPTDRATFAFWIRRGANVIKAISGETAAETAGDWTGDHHGNFHAAFTPGELLGSCKQAAFAEVLRVYAKATNGWARLDQYDAGTEWAFALTPNLPSGGGTGSS